MQTTAQQVKVNALLVNQSGKQIQCSDCRQWGHRRADCPNKRVKRQETRTPLPTQREAFASRNRNQSKGETSAQPKNVQVNHINVKEELEE